MRTLKFRYWNTLTNEIVNNPKMPYKEDWTVSQLFEDRGWHWMQFTGLTDRHGVEIYEGDIVKTPDVLCPIDEVKFIRGAFMPFDHSSPEIKSEECEVIGNIYENPELLKDNEVSDD